MTRNHASAKKAGIAFERAIADYLNTTISGLLMRGDIWLLTAAGVIKNNGDIGEAQYRSHPVTDPLGTLISTTVNQSLLFSGWRAAMTEWVAALAELAVEDLHFRMLGPHEVGRGCGFDTTFPGHEGTFQVWGSARDQVDGFGNGVSPSVGQWIISRLRSSLHRPEAVA